MPLSEHVLLIKIITIQLTWACCIKAGGGRFGECGEDGSRLRDLFDSVSRAIWASAAENSGLSAIPPPGRFSVFTKLCGGETAAAAEGGVSVWIFKGLLRFFGAFSKGWLADGRGGGGLAPPTPGMSAKNFCISSNLTEDSKGSDDIELRIPGN